MIINQGKTILLGQISNSLVNGGVGISSTAVDATDTGLFGGGTTIDEMDASNSANWTEADDALNPSDLTGSAQFQHGTGSMGIGWTTSAGSASYSRSLSSLDLSGKIIYCWFYIADKAALTDTTNAVRVKFGTDSSNYDYFDFSYDELISGWNSLKMDPSSVTGSVSAGAAWGTVDYVEFEFQEDANVSVGNARLDYLRYYSPDELGITEAGLALSKSAGDFFIKTTHTVGATYGNGVDIVEVGDNDGTTVVSRTVIPAVTKGSSTELQVDKYYYWE